MFDNIHFNDVTVDEIVMYNGKQFPVHSDSEKSFSNTTDISVLNAEKLMEIINPRGYADFYIDGVIRTLPMFPVKESIVNQYCWLQSFGWAFSGPKYYTRRANAKSYLMLYTLSGNGYLQYGDVQYGLNSGEGFLIDCQKYHLYKTSGTQWEHIDIHMSGPMLDPIYAEFAQKQNPVFKFFHNDKFMEQLEISARLLDQANAYRDYKMACCLCNIATMILSESSPPSSNSSTITENIRYLVQYIDRHYSENLSLEFLSRFSGISKYYMSREFRRYTGFSPTEYIIRQRINNAKVLVTVQNPLLTAGRSQRSQQKQLSKLHKR